MNAWSKRLLGGLLCLLAVLTSAQTAPAQSVEPVRIGVILPLTGILADFGLKFRAGIEFRLEEAGWKIAGRPVKVAVVDDAGQPAVALDQGKKLVEQDKVQVVIGPFVSGPRLAVEPYFAERRVPTLTLSSHTPAAKKFGWTLFTRGTFWQIPYPLGRYAYEQLGLRTATTLATDFVAGRGYTDAFIEGFKEKGGTIIQQQWAPLGTVDFGPYLVALREADAAVVFLGGPDILRFLKQYAEFGLRKKKMRVLIPTAAALEEHRLQELGDITLGVISADDYLKRLDTPVNKNFVAAFERKYGIRSEKHHAAAYEATSLVIAALEATRGDPAPEKLRSAMLQLKLDTPSGPLSFTPSGVGIRDTYIIEAKKSGNEYVWAPLRTYPQVRHPGD